MYVLYVVLPHFQIDISVGINSCPAFWDSSRRNTKCRNLFFYLFFFKHLPPPGLDDNDRAFVYWGEVFIKAEGEKAVGIPYMEAFAH